MSDELPSKGGNVEKEAQIKQEKKNIAILLILIILSGHFFYVKNWKNGNFNSSIVLAKEKGLESRIIRADEVKKNFQEYREGKIGPSFVSSKELEIPLPSIFETELTGLVSGYPIEEMVPTINQYDREVAAMVIGIAKKESDWGRHAPSINGKTCHNYWGYKGGGSLGWAMGYGCFATPEEGARAICEKIKDLIRKKNIRRPSEMISWKCGSSCASHSPESVNKWISDVNKYFFQVMNMAA